MFRWEIIKGQHPLLIIQQAGRRFGIASFEFLNKPIKLLLGILCWPNNTSVLESTVTDVLFNQHRWKGEWFTSEANVRKDFRVIAQGAAVHSDGSAILGAP